MKTILFALAAGTSLAAAAPATAQYRSAPDYRPQQGQGYEQGTDRGYGYGYGNQGYGADRIARLMDRVERGAANGSISRGEAQNLRNQLRQLDRLERQYARGGLTEWERRDIARRLVRVRSDLRAVEGRGYRNDDRYRDDRYGDDRYDDRRYDRGDDGRWDDDRYDDDDGYREPLGL